MRSVLGVERSTVGSLCALLASSALVLGACGHERGSAQASSRASRAVAQRLSGQARPAQLAIAADGSRSVVAVTAPGRFHQRHALLWRAKPGARFGKPIVLARPTATFIPEAAGLARDGSGVIALASRASGRSIAVQTFDSSGHTTAPHVLARATGSSDFLEVRLLAVAGSGATLVIWTGDRSGLFAAIRDPGHRDFDAPVRVDAVYEGVGVTGSIGDDGTAVTAWTTGDGGTLMGSVRPAGGSFAKPVELDPEGADTNTAVGTNGKGIIIWQRLAFDRRDRYYQAWYSAAAGATGIGKPQRLLFTRGDSPGPTPGDPTGPTQLAVEIDKSGSAVVAFPYSTTRRRTASETSGQFALFAGVPGELKRVGTLGRVMHGYPASARLAAGPGNRTSIAWVRTDARRGIARVMTARTGPASVQFGSPMLVRSIPSGRSDGISVLDAEASSAGTDILALGPGCPSDQCRLLAAHVG